MLAQGSIAMKVAPPAPPLPAEPVLPLLPAVPEPEVVPSPPQPNPTNAVRRRLDTKLLNRIRWPPATKIETHRNLGMMCPPHKGSAESVAHDLDLPGRPRARDHRRLLGWGAR